MLSTAEIPVSWQPIVQNKQLIILARLLPETCKTGQWMQHRINIIRSEESNRVLSDRTTTNDGSILTQKKKINHLINVNYMVNQEHTS